MSLKWLILTFVCVFCAGPDDSQGRSIDFKEKSPKFIGGNTTEWDNYPFIVALTDAKGNIIGGGVILTEEFVLSGQEVAVLYKSSAVRVVSGNVVKEVSAIYADSDIDDYVPGHLAVLQVSTKFDLSGPNITAIELPNESVLPGTRCVVVGVGGDFEKPSEDALHYKNLTLTDKQRCIDKYKHTNFPVPDDDLCGEFDLNKISEYCETNFGDPLLCDGQLIGITSVFGTCQKQENSTLGVFGDVMRYKDWIHEQMNGGPTTDTTTDTATSSLTEATTNTVTETTTPGLASVNSCSVVLTLFTVMFTISRV